MTNRLSVLLRSASKQATVPFAQGYAGFRVDGSQEGTMGDMSGAALEMLCRKGIACLST